MSLLLALTPRPTNIEAASHLRLQRESWSTSSLEEDWGGGDCIAKKREEEVFGGGQQGRGANVSEARDPEANEAFVRMRRRVGELEIECSQYQERLAAANVLLRACTCHGGADGGTERHKAYADHDDSRQRKMDELRRSVRRHKEQLQQRDSLVDWVDQTCNHLLLHMQASDDGEMPRLGARGDTSGGLTSSPLHSTPSRKTAGGRARRGGGRCGELSSTPRASAVHGARARDARPMTGE